MLTNKALKKLLALQLTNIAAHIALHHRNQVTIAQANWQSELLQGIIEESVKDQQALTFALMNSLSHRKFMIYMRKYHGWK